MKYTFKSVTGIEAIVEASSEREARRLAMEDIWDRQIGRPNSIPSSEGKGLDLIKVR